VFATLVGRVRSDPAIPLPGQMPGEIFQMRAVAQLPGPRQGEDIAPALALNQREVVPAGEPRIRHHYHLPAPHGRLKAAQQLAELHVLIASLLRIEDGSPDLD